MHHRHFIMYKPYGYLSQFVGEAQKKKRLGELYGFPAGTMAVGRLDEDSEGLLLLTTDGKMSQYISSSKTEKEYFAQVDGLITEAAVARLQQGVEIGLQGQIYTTNSCVAFKLPAAPDLPQRARKIRDDRHGPTSWVSITLTEGKKPAGPQNDGGRGFSYLTPGTCAGRRYWAKWFAARRSERSN